LNGKFNLQEINDSINIKYIDENGNQIDKKNYDDSE
jgi:hypothetical protein